MSRVPYPFTAIRTDDDDSGKNIVPYATVNAKDEAGAPANIYTAQTGGSASSSFILDANGSKQIWVEPGIYQFSVAGGAYFSVFASSSTTEDFTSAEKEKLGRVLYAVDGISVPFPNAATRASTYMIFDASGNPLGTSRNAVLGDMAFASESTPEHAATLVVNGIDADAAAVRTALNVADGATANATNEQLRDRTTHTGEQPQSSVTGLTASLASKLDDSQLRTSLASPDNSSVPSTLAVASAVADAMAGETPMGAWNAATNSPALASSVGTAGHWYEVSDPGTTNLNGETGWQLRDKAVFNGIIWTRIPADGVRSVDGRTGAIILNYDTVADAAAASLPVGAKVSTKGANAVGDGGHGDFIVSATATYPEDDYSVAETVNGNYLVLQPVNGEFNVLQFGAAGNGTTDDTVAVQRANAFMKARGGGELNFLDRQYKVYRSSISGASGTTPDDYIILVDYSGITFKGIKGKTKIIHDITDTDFTFMRVGVLPIDNGVVALHDVVFKDIEIDGGYTPVEGTPDGGSAIIIAYGVKRFKFTGLHLHNGKDYGIGLQNGGHQDGLIEDCVIEDFGADGIDHKNNGDVSEGNVINNVIVRRFGRHESPSAPYAGIDLMFGWQVSNVVIEEFGAFGTAGAALRLKQGESEEPRGRGGNNTNVTNFKAYAKETPNVALLYLDGIRCSARNCNISNVVIEGVVGAGVRFQQRKNRLTNASCKDGGTGYILEDASYTTEADDCYLVNCDAEGNDVGYRIETDGTKLVNCSGESNGYTFSFPSTATNTTITGGASLTPTTAHILNTGSTTVRIVDCDGIITDNVVESAAFSVTTATTVSVVIDHGIPFDFPERFCTVAVRRSSNSANWTITRIVLVSVTATQATYQVTIGSPSATGGDTATLICGFKPKYLASSI